VAIVTKTMDPYQAGIYACNRCSQACYECLDVCLNEQDINPKKNCMKILIECAKVCEMAVGLMAMNADFAEDYCKICATICDKCAQECKMVQDEHCQKCAQECTTCAEECNKMSGM